MRLQNAIITSRLPLTLQLVESGDGGTVIAYEVRMARRRGKNGDAADHEETPYPLVDVLNVCGHLEQTLCSADFIRENRHPGRSDE